MLAAGSREIVRGLCCIINLSRSDLAHLRAWRAHVNQLWFEHEDDEPGQISLVAWLVKMPCSAVGNRAPVDAFADASSGFVNSDSYLAKSSEYL